MFRKPIDRAMQGDRIGLCVTQFDPDKLERGLICKSSTRMIWSISSSFSATPGVIKIFHGLIVRLNKVRHFKHEIESRTKFHITCGHSTVMGKILLFADRSENVNTTNDSASFDFGKEYEALDQYPADDSGVFVCHQIGSFDWLLACIILSRHWLNLNRPSPVSYNRFS